MINKILSEMTLKEKVGQLCVPILQSDYLTEDIKKEITEYKIGTVRFCPNAEFDNSSVVVGMPNKYFTPGEMANFLNSLQNMAKYPLIITVDQEGGTRSDVNRCNAPVWGGHMNFGAADDTELTYEIAKMTAEEFKAMGINLVQAPICDVFRYPGRQTMKAATIGEDAEMVTRHSVAMKRGFNDGGIISMAKHFPGYGSIATDAHKGTAHIYKDAQSLENEDIVPFKAMIADKLDAVMTGHVIVDSIDPVYPATLSETLINGYLRGKLGFNGLIMTDAMRMKSIQDNYGTGIASVLAVKAGCDLVLLRGDFDHFKEGYDAIYQAAKDGEITEETINASVLRILQAKHDAGLFEDRYADPKLADQIVGCQKHRELLYKLAEKSVSVFKGENLPLSENDGKSIAVISCEMQKVGAACDKTQCIDMLIKEVQGVCPDAKGLMTKLNPTDEDIEKALELGKNSDIIIFGSCSAIIHTNQAVLYNKLKELGKTLIVVAMESPCDIELFCGVKNYIATYGPARDWMNVAVKAIYGKTNADAKCPVCLEI